MARVLVLVTALAVLLGACSSNPESTDEYQDLERQLAEVEQQLSAVIADRDGLIARTEETEDVELPVAAAEALDGYTAAVLAADGNAMLDHVTDGFTFSSYGGIQEREVRASYVTEHYENFEVESLGEAWVLGGGDTYIVAEPERVTTPAVAEGFSVYRLVEVEGVWLVDAHRFVGE